MSMRRLSNVILSLFLAVYLLLSSAFIEDPLYQMKIVWSIHAICDLRFTIDDRHVCALMTIECDSRPEKKQETKTRRKSQRSKDERRKTQRLRAFRKELIWSLKSECRNIKMILECQICTLRHNWTKMILLAANVFLLLIKNSWRYWGHVIFFNTMHNYKLVKNNKREGPLGAPACCSSLNKLKWY